MPLRIQQKTYSPMNVKLLRQIKKIILEKPKKFDLMVWHGRAETFYGVRWVRPLDEDRPCGTVHCIAGWAQMLTKERGNARAVGMAALGLNKDQAQKLFMLDYWPDEFQDPYYEAEGYLEMAKIAARRIEHFIKTKGEE